MREIRTSGSMSGEGKRSGDLAATAPLLDSTQKIEKGCLFWHKHFVEKNLRQRTETAL